MPPGPFPKEATSRIFVYRIPKMQFIISFHRPRLRHSENAGSSIRIVPLRSPLLSLRHQNAGRMGLFPASAQRAASGDDRDFTSRYRNSCPS